MKVFLLVLGVCCHSLAIAATEPVFKCADASGKLVYQKSPCQNLDAAAELNITTGQNRNIAAEMRQDQQDAEANLSEEQKMELKKARAKAKKDQLLALSAEQAQINQDYLKNNKDSFSPYAFPPYKGKRYTSLVTSYLNRLPEIEGFRRVGAAKVLQSGQCKRVEAVELDVYSHIELLRFYVDCRNGKRIKFSEKELQVSEKPTVVDSQATEQMPSETQSN